MFPSTSIHPRLYINPVQEEAPLDLRVTKRRKLQRSSTTPTNPVHQCNVSLSSVEVKNSSELDSEEFEKQVQYMLAKLDNEQQQLLKSEELSLREQIGTNENMRRVQVNADNEHRRKPGYQEAREKNNEAARTSRGNKFVKEGLDRWSLIWLYGQLKELYKDNDELEKTSANHSELQEK